MRPKCTIERKYEDDTLDLKRLDVNFAKFLGFYCIHEIALNLMGFLEAP